MAQDSLTVDTLCHADSVPVEGNAIKPYVKRPGFFKRAYLFCDRIFSPPRDTNYIDVQNYNWCAMVQLTTRLEMFQSEDDDGDFNMRMSPQARTRIGPFFGWRFAFFGYNIDLKSVFMNDDDTDLSASIYSSAFGLDLFYRRVGGQYRIDKLMLDDVDYSSLLKGETVDCVKSRMTRISFYYLFNYKHYSHQAAFSQTNRQLISAGSPIVGFQYAHNNTTIDWNNLIGRVNEINGTDYKVDYNGVMKNDEFSVTAGYGYNWVFAKNFLAAGELTGSIGYLINHVNSWKKNEEDKSIMWNVEDFAKKNLAFNGNLRFAVLYNNGPWFTGIQGVMFYYQHGNAEMVNRNLLTTLYAYVGYNF